MRTASRNSLAGTAMQIPSLISILLVLAQLIPVASIDTRFAYGPTEAMVRDRIRNTALQPGLAASCPDTLNATQVVKDMRLQFAGLNVPESVWSGTLANLQAIDIAPLQVYTTHCFMRGERAEAHGPQWAAQRQRAQSYAAMGMQRAASNSKRGLDH